VGCRAISPELVSLARKLEGRPFHLIATDRQRSDRASQLAYLKGLGLAEDSPNFTLTSGGGHPGVKGNGYVPYYMIFDHRGRLAREHMGGAYHGGDGLAMIDWVDKLLLGTPSIDLGEKPFVHLTALAKEVEARKKLGSTMKAVERRAESAESDAEREEIDRIRTTVETWRDRQIASIDALLATRPSDVVPRLTALAKELRGSALAAAVETRLEEIKGTKPLRDAIAIEKSFRKIKATLARAKGSRRPRAVASARSKLEKLIAGKEDLPIAKTVRDYAAGLR